MSGEYKLYKRKFNRIDKIAGKRRWFNPHLLTTLLDRCTKYRFQRTRQVLRIHKYLTKHKFILLNHTECSEGYSCHG